MTTLADIIANLESGGGTLAGLQPANMVDPTYGQYSGFANEYGSGAAGINTYAQDVLAANPAATWGQFYSSYVLGTGNPANLSSPSTLQSEYPAAYSNLVNNSGVPLDTPLSQLVSGGVSGISASGQTSAAQNGLGGFMSGLTGGLTGSNPSLGFLGGLLDVQQFFLRFGLVIIGGIIVMVALWQLLSDHTPLPSPAQTAGTAKDAAIAAVAAA